MRSRSELLVKIMKIILILGARPQIIKSAPIIHEASEESEIEINIVHTGQHYDYEMSKIFFNELELPNPIVNLGVGSGTHAWQTGNMMIGLEKTIQKSKPDFVLVPGDTNSTLAGALAAIKLLIPVAHLEAGPRTYEMDIPEEVNRRLTDHCSTLLFAPTENCVKNLLKEGVNDGICLAGDPMYDALLEHLPKASGHILDTLDLEARRFAVLTMHRPENVDNNTSLRSILQAMLQLKELSIVFPAHPRTMRSLETTGLRELVEKAEHIKLIEAVGYHEMLNLVKHARIIFTDSGGLQKEAFWLHTPCVTLRKKTPWIETVMLGVNTLAGNVTESIVQKANELIATKNLKNMWRKLPNPFGDGHASIKIIDAFKRFA